MFALVRMTVEMRLGVGKDVTFEQVDKMIEKLLTPTLDPPLPDEKAFVHPEHKEDPKQYVPEELEPKPIVSTFKAQPLKEKDHAEKTGSHYQSPPKPRGRPPKSRPF
jgi:hypothetical protein